MSSLWKNVLGGASEEEEDVLRGIPLFEDLSRRELAALQRLLHRREYVAGESVFTQGEPGLGMYIIAKGAVSIQSEPSGRELVELSDGDFFGEIALLNEVIRTATARAKTDCLLLSLFQPDLMGLLDRNPRLGVKILLALSRLAGMRLAEVSDELEGCRRKLERLQAREGGGPREGGPGAPEAPSPPSRAPGARARGDGDADPLA
ncbi:MAG TPA: cyclic nucleotide-binding domain-containing protein [Rubricoccaceae bacterium]|nr:cyclic nucleotide-binding domain-containing protein [Rubricoccaceae bacterium]